MNLRPLTDTWDRWRMFVALHDSTIQAAADAALAEYMDARGYTVEVWRRAQRKGGRA